MPAVNEAKVATILFLVKAKISIPTL